MIAQGGNILERAYRTRNVFLREMPTARQKLAVADNPDGQFTNDHKAARQPIRISIEQFLQHGDFICDSFVI